MACANTRTLPAAKSTAEGAAPPPLDRDPKGPAAYPTRIQAFNEIGGDARINSMSLERVLMGGRALPLPAFFPSVSSVKTNHAPCEYIELLAATHSAQFLVSAYDIATAS